MIIKTSADFPDGILSFPGNLDLYSFDIFDTLLARRIEPPEAIHEALCGHLSRHLHGQPGSEELLTLRKEAELALRQKSHSAGLDFECHYIDLLEQWVKMIRRRDDDELLVWLRDMELSLELSALFVKDGVIELFSQLKKAGKKIIVTSDMYLGPNEIRTILKHNGLLDFIDRIYVSSTFCRCKYSGRLFKQIMADFSLSPERILHAGDNPVSDYAVPRSLGIHAVLIREREEKRRRRTLSVYNSLSRRRLYWRGKHLLHVAAGSGESSPSRSDFFFDYGKNVLGPVFSTCILGMFERFRDYRIDKVLFLARDGFLLRKLYDILINSAQPFLSEDNYPLPETEYAYLTRQSTASCAVSFGLDHDLAVLALYNPKQQGLYSILNAFGLPPGEFEKEARRHGLEPMKKRIERWDDRRLLNFLADKTVQAKVKDLSRENYRLLVEYLEGIGFFSHRRIAHADIGWNGTIQYFLGRAFSQRSDYPAAYGLYFAFYGGIPYRFSSKDHVEGIFYDAKRKLLTENCVMAFEEIFEEAARAPHATTTGYRADLKTGEVIPVLKSDDSPDRQQEIKCNPMVQSMQEGILEFAREFFHVLPLTGYAFQDLKPFMSTLAERAVVYPRKEEVAMLARLVHTEDWGYDNVLEVETGESIFNLPRILRSSSWRYGTLMKWLGRPSVMLARFMDIVARG